MFEIISQTAFPTVKMFYHLRLPNHLHLVFCSKNVFFFTKMTIIACGYLYIVICGALYCLEKLI